MAQISTGWDQPWSKKKRFAKSRQEESRAAVLSLEVAGAAVTRGDVFDLAPTFNRAMGGTG